MTKQDLADHFGSIAAAAERLAAHVEHLASGPMNCRNEFSLKSKAALRAV